MQGDDKRLNQKPGFGRASFEGYMKESDFGLIGVEEIQATGGI